LGERSGRCRARGVERGGIEERIGELAVIKLTRSSLLLDYATLSRHNMA
jgi:hypothetical protein